MPKSFPENQSRSQMPGWLKTLDDPYGITWRAANVIRRASARRMLRFVEGYLRFVQHKRPVFVIGVPRSGTTSLFRFLSGSSQLGSLNREGHDIWRRYHHPRRHGWQSDAVGAGQVGFGERRFVSAYFYAHIGLQRFVEKTPENALRILYLLDLFPDAYFIIIKRNPCDVINSLINGWREPAGRFRSYYLPEDLSIPGYPHRRRWCFVLINGWREYVSAPVPRIAYAQWAACAKEIARARALVESSRWFELYLEAVMDRPAEILSDIYEFLELKREVDWEERVREMMKSPANILTAPGRDKWREQNREEIEELLPDIAQVALEAGYWLDPTSGKCEIAR